LTTARAVTIVVIVSNDLRTVSDPCRVLVRRRSVDHMRVCTAICPSR
jgi:hypothetical protein